MMPWEVLTVAGTEISEAYRHFSIIDPKLADDFWECFITHISQARQTPTLYRIRKNHIRRINLGTQFHEWYLGYMIWQGKLIVLALGHGKRRPFYFEKRVSQAKRLL